MDLLAVSSSSSPPSARRSPEMSAENSTDPDRTSNVSLLANKYLMFQNPNGGSTNTNKSSCVLKTFQRCIKIETKEQFSCKVVSRNQEGLQIVAGYHRLADCCDAINKLHEVILTPRTFYMIMPPSYGNVHAYLVAKKKLSEPEAANIFKQMVEAVQFCHSKGIVLRDLKMGKFVFHDRERTTVKLDSLEDAVLLNDLSDDRLSDKHGCPNYVSPEKTEILSSDKTYPGKTADIWGLGVILYTLLVGRYPFNDKDNSRLFLKIRRGNYSLPEDLSSSAKCLIRCLLRKDPDSRPKCGEILKHPWFNPGTPQRSSAVSNVNRSSSTTASPQSRPSPTYFSEPNIITTMTDSQASVYEIPGCSRGQSSQCPKLGDSEDQVVPTMIIK